MAGGQNGYDYDWVVIGSGFGGSVAALRLAEKGYRVCVLEAGRRFEDDDFPKSAWRTRRFMWFPALGRRGIMRIYLFKDIAILAGCGPLLRRRRPRECRLHSLRGMHRGVPLQREEHAPQELPLVCRKAGSRDHRRAPRDRRESPGRGGWVPRIRGRFAASGRMGAQAPRDTDGARRGLRGGRGGN